MNITRRSAIGLTLEALACSGRVLAQGPAGDEGQQFFVRLCKGNDETVSRLLNQPSTAVVRPGRGQNLGALAAAYCAPESTYYKSERLVPLMEREVQAFLSAQHPDGTLDAGNIASPPDTAFVVEATTAALSVARKEGDPRLGKMQEMLSRFLLKVGDALVTGGIHTPNHRWVICSALARINSLFPAQKYVDRIDDWLGEGIYQDSDAQFPERSPNYARVEVDAFVTMARLLNRPALLEPVRKYLNANVYLLQPDGELESVQSRRQDQDWPVHVANFYVQYRYMAIRDGNPVFAAVARLAAARSGENLVEGANPFVYFQEDPVLRRPLPGGGAIPSDYRKVFGESQLLRIRRGTRSATIFGGEDRPAEVASGIAHNPTFFSFRNGKAILDSVRMGGQFFSLGVFRAEGIQANGNQAVLRQRVEAPYYQPLPKEYRNAKGDYPLTPARDERFWSKLDFPHRPMSNVQVLDQKVTVTENPNGFELLIEITGAERVPYAVELAFRPGGQFSGVESGERVALLRSGMGVYRVGEDAIEFGPEQAEHENVGLSGHTYQAHGATLKAAGPSVYISGFSPWRKLITIRSLGTKG